MSGGVPRIAGWVMNQLKDHTYMCCIEPMLILRRLLVVSPRALSSYNLYHLGALINILVERACLLLVWTTWSWMGKKGLQPQKEDVLVISCYITNHTKTEWLKTANTYYLIISLVHKFRSSLAGCFWLRGSCSCSLDVGQGCSHSKAWLGLVDPHPTWLTHYAVGRGLSSSPCEPIKTWQQPFHRESNPR